MKHFNIRINETQRQAIITALSKIKLVDVPIESISDVYGLLRCLESKELVPDTSAGAINSCVI